MGLTEVNSSEIKTLSLDKSFVGSLNQIKHKDEMRLSPRVNQHASGVVLGVTQIINGLNNPVNIIVLQNPAFIINGCLNTKTIDCLSLVS